MSCDTQAVRDITPGRVHACAVQPLRHGRNQRGASDLIIATKSSYNDIIIIMILTPILVLQEGVEWPRSFLGDQWFEKALMFYKRIQWFCVKWYM